MLSIHSDEYFMKEALKEAQLAYEEGEIPVGAIVVINNRVIARAHNQVECLGDATAHAEMLAITAAENALGTKYLTDCTLYVTLEPCVMCGGASFWSQIGKIVYGAKDEKRGAINANTGIIHPKTELVEGVLEQECSSLVLNFFEALRKKGL